MSFQWKPKKCRKGSGSYRVYRPAGKDTYAAATNTDRGSNKKRIVFKNLYCSDAATIKVLQYKDFY